MGSQVSTAARLALTAFLACVSIAGGQLRAEPVTDRVLSHYQLVSKNGCLLLKVNFNIRIRYVSHFPVDHGDQVNIVVRPLDMNIATSGTIRESLRPPERNAASLQAITFDPGASQGTVLALTFRNPVAFNVGLGADFQSIIVAIGDQKTGRVCRAEDPFRTQAWETNVMPKEGETVVSRRKLRNGGGETVITRREAPHAVIPAWETSLSEESVPSTSSETGEPAAKGIDQARAAMRKGDMATAIALLKKADGPEATELLGVAYQKNKQTAEAKAVYEDYLRKYGKGEGAEGVRQRLAGIETAQFGPTAALHGGETGGSGGRTPGRAYWSVSASASEFYFRNDSYQKVRDPTQPLNLNDTADDHQVHQNTLMSNLDLFAAWGNDYYKSKFRFSGQEDHGFNKSDGDIASVSALYFDTTIRDWGTSARIGRQTHNGDGVLGRFDGAVASWQPSPWFRLSAVGGSPVASRRDGPFKDDRYFYGASVNFGPILGGFDASVFAIQQMDREIIDRQAVGTELRYVDLTKSAFITVDYDTHFNELNAAIFSGTWTLPDKSTVRAGADYRKAPYLTTWNALQNQPYKTLYDMLKANIYSQDQIDQMAVDRTATYKSASLGYTRQLTEKLQLNLDATAAHIDGTIASFGVDATPSTGDEYYYSAQLVGNNLLTEDDLWTVGARYSDLHESDNWAVDLSTRYQLRKDLRISPRLLLGYRNGKTLSLEEYSVLPSLLLDYYWTKDLNLELEVGSRFTWRTENLVDTKDTEVFITAGVRYDFYAGSDTLK